MLSGCATLGTSVGRIVDPFNLMGMGPPPVRIGITHLELSPLLVPRAVLFEENLTFHLGAPVIFDLMTPHQIHVHLDTGRLKFAMLSTREFCQVAPDESARIVAVALNEHRQSYRKGLLIVSAQSEAKSLEDLQNYRFHLLPRDHVLNDAALGALLNAGVAHGNLIEGIRGVELVMGRSGSADVARCVAADARAAGVIDETDYRNWPATGGAFAGLTPSRDMFRVIGETIRVPEGPFVASAHTDPELVEKVRRYLLEVLPQRKLVLGSLGLTGFAPPVDLNDYEAYCALYRQLHPADVPSVPAAGKDL
ncbi:MAG TPA: PhnD/SsuA/transferrin family substrate-binding protein [Phycisphaerae bacterium]|nr:PhnD/SsuA/transferrin family substrate-binding protein [Phycisphaerae bacterium]HOL27936.1 PhnD/SsuA/transferrin family substrate-binding protein [Phycisphaerae bacterium]HPP21721.1 PhnD/SsuA/transferrin family substrate-binding protein [Phycisphaerae bacterium]HPU31566.1 PhnD/SsuA/transferrin family substrate-binding protein [Phycisphaerae bacterium]HQA43264.1 PhnD/SsuA/transferrin family substrate-binding protein [Phycisphaerae bacterium]